MIVPGGPGDYLFLRAPSFFAVCIKGFTCRLVGRISLLTGCDAMFAYKIFLRSCSLPIALVYTSFLFWSIFLSLNTTMQSSNTTEPVYGIDLPEWAIDFCRDFGGIFVQPINQSQLLDMCELGTIKKLMVYERFVLEQTEILFGLLQQQRVESLIVYNNHPFALTDQLLDRLNAQASTQDVSIMVNGYYDRMYSAIKIYNLDACEHAISHHCVLLLSQILQKKRRPTKMFAIQTVAKDKFRNTVLTHLQESALWKDFFSPPLTTTEALCNKADNMLQLLEKQHGHVQYIDALRSFGNGQPNFKMYESAFCELTLETKNTGSWHFTEKTWRPIALGIPVVHLGHQPMYDQLLSRGYCLYDHDGFYQQWHAQTELERKLPYLEKFLTHILTDKSVQEQMQQIAQQNYLQFWNQRKNHYYTHIQSMFNDIAGEDTILHKIYSQLDS
jgi:hypothetical protein